MAKGYFPYHHLATADFPVNDVDQPDYGMYTWGFFHYHFRSRCEMANGQVTARATEWLVWSGFDRNKSSRKPGFKFADEFLPHEQGHLDINELYSRRLAETPLASLPVGVGTDVSAAREDLKRKLQDFVDRTSREGQKEQDRYDLETAHGKNAAKQSEWTASIQARLEQAGIHS